MVEIFIQDRTAVLNVKGLDKLWAFQSRLVIPLAHIRSVRQDPAVVSGWKGFRVPGTYIPGVLTAGTFYQDGRQVFWDVHRPESSIVIDLADDRYDQLIVEVADPDGTVPLLEEALKQVREAVGEKG